MILIGVKYTCGLCTVVDATVQVPARPSEMDLEKWMANLTAIIQADHQRRTPGCPARKLKQVAIPVSNAEWIGGPPIQ